MAAHARLGPSSYALWMNCPGGIDDHNRLNAATDPDDVPVHTQEGTEAHDYLEGYLKGEPVETRTYKYLDDEGKDHVHTMIDYILSRYTEGCTLYSERTVNPGKLMGREDFWGTLDVSLENPKEGWLEVMDLKFGKGVVVEASNNYQLLSYAIGALAERPSWMPPIEMVRLTILQPRAYHYQGPIRSVELTPEEVHQGYLELKAAAERTDDPNAPRVAGDAQCKWCRVVRCTERAERVLASASGMFQPIKPAEFNQAAVLREPQELTMDELFVVLDNRDLIRGFLNKVEEYVNSQIQAGNEVPGWKLIAGRGSKSFSVDEKEVEDKIRNLHFESGKRIGRGDITTTKLMSPSQLEKKIKPHVPKSTWKIIEAMIVKKAGKPKLAPITDPSPALAYTAKQMFSPVEAPADYDFLK